MPTWRHQTRDEFDSDEEQIAVKGKQNAGLNKYSNSRKKIDLQHDQDSSDESDHNGNNNIRNRSNRDRQSSRENVDLDTQFRTVTRPRNSLNKNVPNNNVRASFVPKAFTNNHVVDEDTATNNMSRRQNSFTRSRDNSITSSVTPWEKSANNTQVQNKREENTSRPSTAWSIAKPFISSNLSNYSNSNHSSPVIRSRKVSVASDDADSTANSSNKYQPAGDRYRSNSIDERSSNNDDRGCEDGSFPPSPTHPMHNTMSSYNTGKYQTTSDDVQRFQFDDNDGSDADQNDRYHPRRKRNSKEPTQVKSHHSHHGEATDYRNNNNNSSNNNSNIEKFIHNARVVRQINEGNFIDEHDENHPRNANHQKADSREERGGSVSHQQSKHTSGHDDDYAHGSNSTAAYHSSFVNAGARISFVLLAHARGLKTNHVQCTVIRDRSSLQSKLYPSYQLILEEPRKTLIIAQKMSMNRTSNYHLFDMTRGQAGSKLSKKSGNYLGKLRARNTNRTSYALLNQNADREELAGVLFDRVTMLDQLKDGNQPRKLKVLLPLPNEYYQTVPVVPSKYRVETLADLLLDIEEGKKVVPEDLALLKTKEPTFENGNYRLNFHGRVSLPSVKNFQIVNVNNTEDILCQFGKVDEDEFHLDFKAPFNAVQAFALAICQFNL